MEDRIDIISYPKAGRTWLRSLIGKYLVLKYNLPETKLLEIGYVSRACGLFITNFIHDGAEWTIGNPPKLLSNISYQSLSTDKSKYADKKIILLKRDVKDIVVSAYFQATKRENVFSGDISTFIKSDDFGIKRILSFYQIWEQNKKIPKEFLSITYEDLHRDPNKIMKDILVFMGENEVDDQYIKESISFCSFDNLQKAEKENKFNSFRLQAGSNTDPESFKVRKGKIGGYKEYLSKEDIKYIDDIIKEFQN